MPPIYFVYGTRDPFVNQFEKCMAALKEAEISVESHVLDRMPHGFGSR
ncbi:MAG: alpha/beta hydrolase fold domain-containing protein [Lachnospiraceae bacterium]|nr:alpha/beta hydrolase fold domain-containing protein [Lachnospiraceae bacterium]